jgi:hypothetical protein
MEPGNGSASRLRPKSFGAASEPPPSRRSPKLVSETEEGDTVFLTAGPRAGLWRCCGLNEKARSIVQAPDT